MTLLSLINIVFGYILIGIIVAAILINIYAFYLVWKSVKNPLDMLFFVIIWMLIGLPSCLGVVGVPAMFAMCNFQSYALTLLYNFLIIIAIPLIILWHTAILLYIFDVAPNQKWKHISIATFIGGFLIIVLLVFLSGFALSCGSN